MTTRIRGLLAALALTGALLGTAPASWAAPHAKISPKQAAHVVLHRYPGRIQGKIALENEDGSWQYSVMVKSHGILREVMVDAKTGKIASVEVTSQAKEGREAKEGHRAGSREAGKKN